MVIDHQHLQGGNGQAGFGNHGRLAGRAGHQRHRHVDLHAGTLAKHTVQGQVAAHQVTQVATDRQTQACTATRQLAIGVGLGEGQEQALLVLFANADTGVLYAQFKPGKIRLGARLQAQLDDDLTLLGEFDCIADQVRKDLLHP
ncbi:hypothetical protein D3C79_569740 [compost metagenome]